MYYLSLFYLLIFVNFVQGLFDNEINLECKGKKYDNVTITAYYPDYNNQDHERGYQDKMGKKLRTLQDYIDDRAEYVTLSVDEKLAIPYGAVVCIPQLNKHFGHRIRFEIRDSSIDLYGMGYQRADICVRTEIDSYDLAVNRKVTLVFT